jgi:uncharacterized repeat protein (TIGR01451 family)
MCRLARSAAIGCATSALFAAGAVAAAEPETAQAQSPPPAPATCVIHSLPSFTAQGEGASMATVADVVEVECDPTIYGTGSKIKLVASQLFSRCNEAVTWLIANPFSRVDGRSVTLALDADGSATVALLAGPGCQAGESLVTAHMEEAPFESFTTSFAVLPPVVTPPGLFALPATQVEDSLSSGVATIVQAEFENGSEKTVRIGSEELYSRCRIAPHLRWFRIDRSEVDGPEVTGVPLDNDGNGFVIAIGDGSCAPGASLIEGDLEAKPFTTFTAPFTILPPQPTGEPSFTIEKRQEIAGSGAGFTTAPLKGAIGETVDYQITIVNTSKFAETLSAFLDTHCDPGTIAGGPGSSPLAAGGSTTYTCEHALSSAGSYANEATVTATTVGGNPLTLASNQVVVETTETPVPAFAIEKLQRIAGSAGGFTAATVTGTVGQTVEYEIVVKNIGGAALTLSSFTDVRCDGGTIAGGPGHAPVAPGSSTTYTCSHVLTSAGAYVNEASATAAVPGGSSLTETSNMVEAIVSKSSAPQAISSEVPAPVKQAAHGGVLSERCEVPGALHGASGLKRGPFTLQISSLGIKQIMFYLDGREIKALKQAQAKAGRFTLAIDPRKLSYGPHNVTIKTFMSNRACARITRKGVFVRPHTPQVTPTFTG